jgi:Uma2 family endonuclease
MLPPGYKSSYIMDGMQVVLNDIEADAPIIIQPRRSLSDREFFHFCEANPDLNIERNTEGEIVIMPPTGGEASYRNMDLSHQMQSWSKRDGRGKAFESNGLFILPSGAARAPDVSWVLRSRLAALTPDQKKRFIPLCPDFVVELLSPSDRLSTLQAKMREWIDNGAQLAWLIDPESRTVYIYRPGKRVERLMNAARIDGGDPVRGFVLEMADIWDPDL